MELNTIMVTGPNGTFFGMPKTERDWARLTERRGDNRLHVEIVARAQQQHLTRMPDGTIYFDMGERIIADHFASDEKEARRIASRSIIGKARSFAEARRKYLQPRTSFLRINKYNDSGGFEYSYIIGDQRPCVWDEHGGLIG